jgi:hypothetical protein
VLNTVRLFTQTTPKPFKEIARFFSKELQGSYGVVVTLDELKERKKKNQTEDQRWFNEPDEILTSDDGVKFVVSNEWGENFATFQKYIKDKIGWSLVEVK